jgi:hypothetical protein
MCCEIAIGSAPASPTPSSLSAPSRSTRITLVQIRPSHDPFRIRTSASVASKELKTPWNQHLQETGGGVVTMVNQVIETSHPPSSHAGPPWLPVFHLPYTLPSSVSRNSLFATLTKTAGVCAQNSQSGTPLVLAGERAELYSGGQSEGPRNNPRQFLKEKEQ